MNGDTYLYDLSTDKKNSFLANFKNYSTTISNENKNNGAKSVIETQSDTGAEIDYPTDAIAIVNEVINDNPSRVIELIKIINPSTDPNNIDLLSAPNNAIVNYIKVYLLNYFIHYSIDSYIISGTTDNVLDVTINKDAPDEYEKQDISNEFSVMSIVTSFALNSSYKWDIAKKHFGISINGITLNNTYGVRFNVVYKELNPYRREIGSSSLFESVISTALL
jgi:hypothetical protein